MRYKQILSFVLMLGCGLAVLLWVVFSLDVREIISQIGNLSAWEFGVLFILALANFGLGNLRWQIILYKLGHRTNFLSLYFHLLSGYAISYVTPIARAGGEPVRIYFLRKIDRIRLRDATSSVLTDKAIELSTLALFGICGILIALSLGLVPRELKVVFEVLAGLTFVFIFYFFYRLLRGRTILSPLANFFITRPFPRLAVVEKRISHIEHQIINFFHHDPLALLWTLLLSIITTSVMVFEFWLTAKFFGLTLTATQAFVIMTISGLAFLVPIPGGFGVFEGGQAAIALWLGLSPTTMLAVAVVIRIKDVLLTLLGFGHILQHSTRGLFQTLSHPIEEVSGPVVHQKANFLQLYHHEITHGFFGREGGISKKDFSSLNVSFRIGDKPHHVRENRERIRTTLEIENLVSAHQAHGTEIALVDGHEYHEIKDVDVLVCATPGVGIMIQTADCVPILVFDPEHRVVAAIHAGWRGTRENILERTIVFLKQNFHTNPKDLVGAIGPCIDVASYHFPKAKEIFPNKYHKFIERQEYLNLPAINAYQWQAAGADPKKLELLNISTAKNTKQYFSYRVEKETGRQASIIGLKA